jgi:hypothetical protein
MKEWRTMPRDNNPLVLDTGGFERKTTPHAHPSDVAATNANVASLASATTGLAPKRDNDRNGVKRDERFRR